MIVDLVPNDEQRLIEDSVKSFIADKLPLSRLREADNHGGGAETKHWSDFAALGLFGLGLAEADGGIGLGLAEEAIVAQAFGAGLVSLSALAQVIAPHLALDGDLRAALMSGSARAAIAAVDGHAIDAEEAQWLVILSANGASLCAKSDVHLGETVELIDESIAARRVQGIGEGGKMAARVSLLLAAYLTGIAQTATDMAVEYAKTREQFGQPIGGFQAIKHLCADMAVRAAAAHAQTFHTAILFSHLDQPDGETAAARLLAAEAARENAMANIQIHGGMGFTAEGDAHWLLKRAQVVASLGANRGLWQSQLIAS